MPTHSIQCFISTIGLVPLNLIRIRKHFRRSQTRGTRGKLLTRKRSKAKNSKAWEAVRWILNIKIVTKKKKEITCSIYPRTVLQCHLSFFSLLAIVRLNLDAVKTQAIVYNENLAIIKTKKQWFNKNSGWFSKKIPTPWIDDSVKDIPKEKSSSLGGVAYYLFVNGTQTSV